MAKRAKKAAPPPAKRRRRPRNFIVRLDTYEGDDTACYLLGADPMWIVIAASPSAGATVIDCGYRSLKEAREAWPEAVVPEGEPRVRDRSRAIGWNRIPPVFSEPYFQKFWKGLKEGQKKEARRKAPR